MSDVAPPYPQIVEEANQVFQSLLPGAFTFTAWGMPRSGIATKPSQLTKWIFIATSNGAYARLHYENGRFGQPEKIGGWLGDELIPLPQGTLSLQQAIDILYRHGATQGFGWVQMGTPAGPNPQPMYWFCVNGQVQGVSASTGEIFHFPWTCSRNEVGQPRKP